MRELVTPFQKEGCHPWERRTLHSQVRTKIAFTFRFAASLLILSFVPMIGSGPEFRFLATIGQERIRISPVSVVFEGENKARLIHATRFFVMEAIQNKRQENPARASVFTPTLARRETMRRRRVRQGAT
jgi:hypothetical protein